MSFFLAIRKRKYTRSVPGCAGKPPRAVRRPRRRGTGRGKGGKFPEPRFVKRGERGLVRERNRECVCRSASAGEGKTGEYARRRSRRGRRDGYADARRGDSRRRERSDRGPRGARRRRRPLRIVRRNFLKRRGRRRRASSSRLGRRRDRSVSREVQYGPSAGPRDGSGGSRSGRAGPPSTATSHAVSGLRGGTPCRFEMYARGTPGKGAGSFATAIPLPRSCESPARSPEPPAGPPDDGNLENAFPAGEPTPYGPAPSPPVNRRTAPGSPEGERKTHGRLRQTGGVGHFFHAVMAGTSLDNVFYELL